MAGDIKSVAILNTHDFTRKMKHLNNLCHFDLRTTSPYSIEADYGSHLVKAHRCAPCLPASATSVNSIYRAGVCLSITLPAALPSPPHRVSAAWDIHLAVHHLEPSS